MKYGVLVFKETTNIGDDVQSYASRRFLPHYKYLIEREELISFESENNEVVSSIMNAWYSHKAYNCILPNNINPFFVAMHITENKKDYFTTGYGKECFGKYNIGARDESTLKILKDAEMQSYFSGCLTLTLQKFDNVKKENNIVVVDVRDNELEYIKSKSKSDILEITHNVDPDSYSKIPFETRFENVEKLLKTYQSAKLVITSRLHVALPCLALGTPVLLIENDNHKDRFSSFLPMINTVISSDFVSGKIDINDIKENPTIHMEYREKLIKKCTEFIEECENGKYDKTVIKKTTKEIIDITNWQKDTLYNEMKKRLNRKNN